MIKKLKLCWDVLICVIGMLIVLRAEGGLSCRNGGNFHVIGTRGGW